MPKPSPMSPDIRENIKTHLRVSITTFLRDLAGRYFSNPTTSESRQVLIEANAEALHELTKDEPHGRAALATFATELQDKEQSK
jgi:hypothetical protein